MIRTKKGGDSIESPHEKDCGERLTIRQRHAAVKGYGERLTIRQRHAAVKGYGERLTIRQHPAQINELPGMPLLTPECIIFYYLFLKTLGRKDARAPEKPFLLKMYLCKYYAKIHFF
jgi:hypothetical protein